MHLSHISVCSTCVFEAAAARFASVSSGSSASRVPFVILLPTIDQRETKSSQSVGENLQI